MARLNTQPSVLYTRRASATPGYSDQENCDPAADSRAKGKQRAVPMSQESSLPTPPDGSEASRGLKRRRVSRDSRATQGAEGGDMDMQKFNKYFNPNQDLELRREIKRKSRALEREFQETRDDLLRDNGDALVNTIEKADRIYRDVKQTNDAIVDSRLLVNVSDLAYKKTAQLVLGDSSTGVDVDEFLSKCINFMRNGGPSNNEAASGSRRRRTQGRMDRDNEDEDDAVGEILDWEVLGRHACFPYNARPAVPSFLLGPLSVEKKQRTQTQRRARQAKDTTGREARPEALTKDDLQQSDENGLTAICTRIKRHLEQHVFSARAALERAGFTEDTPDEEMDTDRFRALLKRHRITVTGGPSLFEYVINPHSFGQTVENIFYISFLIKEGVVGVLHDTEEMPTLIPANATTLEDKRDKQISKHQAVLAIDYTTWQQLIQAFDIREPMIPHRDDEPAAQLGSRGWYA